MSHGVTWWVRARKQTDLINHFAANWDVSKSILSAILWQTGDGVESGWRTLVRQGASENILESFPESFWLCTQCVQSSRYKELGHAANVENILESFPESFWLYTQCVQGLRYKVQGAGTCS